MDPNRIVVGTRVALGLVFFIVGTIGLLRLAPIPTYTGRAADFLEALRATNYLWATINALQVLCGALLGLGFFVPLMLVLLAPLVFNIVLYHIFLEPVGLPIAVILLALELFLAYCHRASFQSLFELKADPRL